MAQHLALPHQSGPTPGDLPDYLGFGLLDQDSIGSENGWLTATYSDEHDVVYEVRWNANGCLLKSYWRGREVGRSDGPDLQKAFFSSWLYDEKSWEDERFIDLSNEIIAIGNVYSLRSRLEYVFYPAGVLFTLRQAIPEGSLSAWEAFKRTLEAEAALPPRRTIYLEAPGSILHLLEDGDTWREPVLVVDLVVSLARLPQAVRQCVDGGIVPRGLHHRLLVSTAGSGIVWQTGDQAQRERAFAVISDEELTAARGAVPPPSALSAEAHAREGGNR